MEGLTDVPDVPSVRVSSLRLRETLAVRKTQGCAVVAFEGADSRSVKLEILRLDRRHETARCLHADRAVQV